MEDKQFDASDKKKEDEKKKGNVPKSAEFTGSFLLIVGFFTTIFVFQAKQSDILNMFKSYFAFNETYSFKNTVSVHFLKEAGWSVISEFSSIFGPIALSIFIIAIIINIAQFGFVFNPIKIDFSKINIINGLKNFLTAKKAIDFIKLFFKINLALVVFFGVYYLYLKEVSELNLLTIYWSISNIYEIFLVVVSLALFIGFIFAVIDLVISRHFYFKKLKMSFQDLKDEHKQTSGDPLIKQRIREAQRKLASESSMNDIGNSSFVVTNPTHYAVAVRYSPELGDELPKVVAKGVDFLALKIKNIANDNNVRIIEDPPLARALHSQTEIGQYVPMEFFKPIAELINYVNKLNDKKRL